MVQLGGIILVALGAATLLFGRRFFFLFVALAGFFLGYELMGSLFENLSDTVRILSGIVVGGVFAYLGTRFLGLLARVAAFILMGAAAQALASMFGFDLTSWTGIIIFVVGGLIGLGLVTFVFDWGLIIVTSLAGSSLAIAGLIDIFGGNIDNILWSLLAFALTAGGIYFQYRSMNEQDQAGSA